MKHNRYEVITLILLFWPWYGYKQVHHRCKITPIQATEKHTHCSVIYPSRPKHWPCNNPLFWCATYYTIAVWSWQGILPHL